MGLTPMLPYINGYPTYAKQVYIGGWALITKQDWLKYGYNIWIT